MTRLVNYPSLTQGALHPDGAGMFTVPQTFGNIARMPMFTDALFLPSLTDGVSLRRWLDERSRSKGKIRA